KVVQQQANDLVRAQRSAVAVHGTDTVRISIRDEADVMRMFSQKRGAAYIIMGNGLGVYPSEKWVMLSVQRSNFACSSREQLFEACRADSKKSFMGKPQA